MRLSAVMAPTARIGVGEAADLPLLIIQQPTDTLLRWVPFNLWAVLVWHAPELFHMFDA